MSYTTLAFFTGLFASLHCVAMCGPLMLALPFSGRSAWYVLLFQRLLYQTGRILVYALLGALVGLTGESFSLLGFQQGLSIFSGVLLLIIGASHFSKSRFGGFVSFQTKFTRPLTTLLALYFSKPYGSFVAGALNGLIPCGIVYMALAGSLNAGSALLGSKFMFLFGLGTTPLILIVTIAPAFFKKRINIPALAPYLLLIAGIWLIYRGANSHVLPENRHTVVSRCK